MVISLLYNYNIFIRYIVSIIGLFKITIKLLTEQFHSRYSNSRK